MTFRSYLALIALATVPAVFLNACSGDDTDEEPAVGGAGGAESVGSHAGEAHGGDAPHADGSAECSVLGTLCHDADTGEGRSNECHELGHVGDADACTEQFGSCVSTCLAESAGEGGAGGAATVSNPYCQALGRYCHFLDDEGTPTGECHELGHVGNEPDCVEAFAGCVPLCKAKHDAEDGAGGAEQGAGGAHSDGDAHGEGGTHHEGGSAG